jgi:hypothetical protein
VKKAVIKDDAPWVMQWYQYLSNYSQGYNFCFAQVFSQVVGPNIMLCWKDGAYVISSVRDGVVLSQNMMGFGAPYGSPIISPDMAEDRNRWVTWRMEVILGVNGRVTIFRDGVQIGDLQGNFPGGTSYWKQGIYTQPARKSSNCVTGLTTMWLKNTLVVQAPYTYPPLEVLSLGNLETYSTIDPLSVIGRGNRRDSNGSAEVVPVIILAVAGAIGMGFFMKRN